MTTTKLWNWRLWAGFGFSLLALVIYALLLLRTRSIFWVSLVLFALSATLLISGLKRGFAQPQLYRGARIVALVLAAMSMLVLGVFAVGVTVAAKYFPAAAHAPQVGQKAPEFITVDSHGNSVALAQLLSTAMASSSGVARTPKGVLLVFYRGYW